jgi:8-oxo-dGTP diphosphatase
MEYKLIPLTTDSVILKQKKILLIKRAKEPFKDCWALPGGFVEYGETVEAACLRELEEETTIKGKIKQLVGVYSHPKRDPRGHVISVAFLITNIGGKEKSGDDAKEIKWFDCDNLPELAFDHLEIIKDALQSRESNNCKKY